MARLAELTLGLALVGVIACAPNPAANTPETPAAQSPAVGSPAPPVAQVATGGPSVTERPPKVVAPAPKSAGPALVAPCKPDSPDHDAAYAALDALDQAIKTLGKSADPKPRLAELDALVELPCLKPAAAHLPYQLGDVKVGWTLKDWWDRGGHSWLHFYLELGGPPSVGMTSHHIDVPVGLRPTLTKQSRPQHPLLHLLCDETDEACHAAPKGWRARAKTWFELDGKRRTAAQRPVHDSESCLARAKEHPEVERYQRWYDCMVPSYDQVRMFPLGGMRAAEDGWLIVQGRRGHYSFCDEIRAYDLKTGAFYATQSCSGLRLRNNGSVNQRATNDARKPQQIVGRLPLDAIREAAWMLFIADELSEPGVDWHSNPAIPDELRIGWPADGGIHTGSMRGFTTSSGQTTLAWRYQRRGKALASGKLRWPNDYNHAGKDHAVKLLKIAEADLVEGCAPARLPKLRTGSSPGVAAIDASPQSIRDADKALQQALDDLRRKARRCR